MWELYEGYCYKCMMELPPAEPLPPAPPKPRAEAPLLHCLHCGQPTIRHIHGTDRCDYCGQVQMAIEYPDGKWKAMEAEDPLDYDEENCWRDRR